MNKREGEALRSRRRPILQSIEWSGQNGDSACTVELSHGRFRVEGQAEMNGSHQGPAQLAAEAALEALRWLCDAQLHIDLETANVTAANGNRIATVVVATAGSATNPVVTVGAAVVHFDDTVAVVRATLDALNRTLFERVGSQPLRVDQTA